MSLKGILLVLAAASLGFAQQQKPAPTTQNAITVHGLSSILDSMQAFILDTTNPQCTEEARIVYNATRVLYFEKMFPSGYTFDAYVVFNKFGFVKSIYPFPPEGTSRRYRAEGLGTWSQSIPATGQIVPYIEGISERMTNWDTNVKNTAEQHQYSFADAECGNEKSSSSTATAQTKSNPNYEVPRSDQTVHVDIPSKEQVEEDKTNLAHLTYLGDVTSVTPKAASSSSTPTPVPLNGTVR